MISKTEEIQKLMDMATANLIKERDTHGGYESWYQDLKPFRDQLEKYVYFDKYHRRVPRLTYLENNHMIDHHVLGYFAPLDFQRIGFEGEKRTPAQQIAYLNDFLKSQDVRFIYVALPCKKAIYPEIAVEPHSIPKDGHVIPQWRKMISEMLSERVEVVDLYEDFLSAKYDMELYCHSHVISCMGAELIGRRVAQYIQQTTQLDDIQDFQLNQTSEIVWSGSKAIGDFKDFPFAREKQKAFVVRKKDGDLFQIYNGTDRESYERSEIVVFGNCNLNQYELDGTGIHSNMAYHLGHPIRYGGRYLPFSPVIGEKLVNMPKSLLKNCKILIEIGFPSGSFVRAPHGFENLWNLKTINQDVFQ